jgi:hypothetical protein
MSNSKVSQLIREDVWSAIAREGDEEFGPSLLRFRTPVLGPPDTVGYPERLRILWAYANEGSGELPSEEESAALGEFENRLCPGLEHDDHAALVAVLTFDGARQWVFYTKDCRECVRRIEAMPQNEDPYPIEIDARTDAEWIYLRHVILKNVDPDMFTQ